MKPSSGGAAVPPIPGIDDPVGLSPATDHDRWSVTHDGEPVVLHVAPGKVRTADRRLFEARLAALVALGRVPGLDPIVDGGVAGGRRWWTTPAEGEPLGPVRPRPVPEALILGVDLATGLGRMHSAGLVHGAISPDAVLAVPEGGRLVTSPLPPLTEADPAVAAGSGPAPRHIAPEVLEGRPPSPAADMWALGSTLYELLEGSPPFAREADRGVTEVLLAITLGNRVGFRNPNVVEGLRRAVERALDADPDRRPGASAFGALLVSATDAPLADRLDTVAPPPAKATAGEEVASEVGRPLGSAYLLTEPIGRGAMGRVWRGVRRADGTAIAVKVLRPELADDAEQVSRFLLERNALRSVVDAHVVPVHDLVVEGSVLAIVMDLVEGGDLRTALGTEGRLAPARAAHLLAGVALGLAAVHRAGIVHRDVKPENVMLTGGEPPVKLTDFGIARIVDGATLTRQTQLVGTPDYVAPELAAGRQPSPAADVYALGVMAYEVLVGRRPFVGPTPVAVLRAHLDEPPLPPPDIEPSLWGLLAECLAKDPGLRPAADQVAERLEDLGPVLSGRPPLAALPVPPPAPLSRLGLSDPVGAAALGAPAVPAPAAVALAGPDDEVDRLETRAGRRSPLAPPDANDATKRGRLVIGLAALIFFAVLLGAAGWWTARRDTDASAASAESTSSSVALGANTRFVGLPVEEISTTAAGRVVVTYSPPSVDDEVKLVLQMRPDGDDPAPTRVKQSEFAVRGEGSTAPSGNGGEVLTFDRDRDGANEVVSLNPSEFDVDLESDPEACVFVFLPYEGARPEPEALGVDSFTRDCTRILTE